MAEIVVEKRFRRKKVKFIEELKVKMADKFSYDVRNNYIETYIETMMAYYSKSANTYEAQVKK